MRIVVTLLLLFTSAIAFGGELRVQLPDRDDCVIDVPDGWKSQVNRPRPDLPPTVVLSSSQPRAFQVLLTPVWPIGGGPAPTLADTEALVRRAIQGVQGKAVEKSISLLEFKAGDKVGYYFQATDRDPEPDGYKYLTQGAIQFKELRITFTVLANDSGRQAKDAAMSILRSMRRAKTKGAA